VRAKIAALVVAAGLSAAAAQLVERARAVGINQGYEPVQPIAFSHLVHAGDNRIPCQYCHFAAEQSRHAGIPPMNVCMNCHARLKVASAEVQKLREAVEQGRAIHWIKVHNLPDFVYFSHSQHVLGGLACQQCHGPVETMARVRQVSPLTMGWCLDCHRRLGVTSPSQRGIHLPGDDTAATGGKLGTSQIAAAVAPPHRPTGGTDCSKCHI
jgi:Cytochrome c7 and related cytochrome c/Class III cytochrome C family